MSLPSEQTLLEMLDACPDWASKYSYLIELGGQLAPLPETFRLKRWAVIGCQSQVWLGYTVQAGQCTFYADSDAFIVRGLLAILLVVYNDKSPREIVSYDIAAFLKKIDLLEHLSPLRGQGIQAVDQKIRFYAMTQLQQGQ